MGEGPPPRAETLGEVAVTLLGLGARLSCRALRMMIFRRDLDRDAIGSIKVHPITVSPGVEV